MADATDRVRATEARARTVRLPAGAESGAKDLTFLSFGEAGARPKAYLQAGLHADELPGLLVLRNLGGELERLAERGAIRGEIVLAPVANPIGLAQEHGGYLQGRLDRETGRNFNRGFPDLAAAIAEPLAARLSDAPQANAEAARDEMRRFFEAVAPEKPVDVLQAALMAEACDADIVLDLHADNEALVHLYTSEVSWPGARDLAAEIDARAVLIENESGGGPFDEAVGGVWRRLSERFPQNPLPNASLSATLELGSNNDVDPDTADRLARALVRFLMRRGSIDGEAGALPRLLCDATPLRAVQQVKAASEGLVVYRARLGDRVRTGDVVAEIVPPFGEVETVEACTDGLLFARHDQRWASPGKVIGKIAGSQLLPERTGDLLTD